MDIVPADDGGQLARQLALVTDWLMSDDAGQFARRLVSRRSLPRSGDELVNETWLRVRSIPERRSEPYPSLDTPAEAAKFGARVMDNLSRDWARSHIRRQEVELVEAPGEDSGAASAERRIVLEQLLVLVGSRGVEWIDCDGCPDAVVIAAAMELIHLVLVGHESDGPGRTWIDQMLHVALDRVDDNESRTVAARNQRKSRCGRCTTDLLRTAMTKMEVEVA